MVVTAIINYILGFIMTVTLMCTVGNVDEVLDSPTGQPYVQVSLASKKKGTTIDCI